MSTGSGRSKKQELLGSASFVAIATALTLLPVQAQAQEADEGGITLEEILVTARKREENLQDIPASVQALTEAFLKDSGAQSMADYGRFIPAMSVQAWTGAQGAQVFFRGISSAGNDFIASASASIYLDESSVTIVGASPNLRLIDVSRIEALAGPQGTLYGASAQSGTLRIYTNQPDTSEFSIELDMTFKDGADSSLSRDIIGVINVPLIEDKFAIRIAVNEGKDGGFIDNVYGHTPNTMYGDPVGVGSNKLPAKSGTLDNAHVVEDNFNYTNFATIAVSARWEINEDWSATGSYRYSENISHGTGFFNPFVGDLEVIQFNPSLREEKWDVGSLVIEGDLGWAQVVSSTSFYKRDYFYNLDSTAYMRYYANWACTDTQYTNTDYYWLFFDGGTGNGIYYAKYCMGANADDDWTGIVTGPESQDRFSQEIRMVSQGDDFDWLAGVYYEDANDDWDNNWMVPGHGGVLFPNSFAAKYWRQQGFAQDNWPGISDCPACVAQVDEGIGGLFSRDRTNFEQKAIFGELTWHATEKFDLTLGGRYFERTTNKQYLQWHVTTGTHRDPEGILNKFGYNPGESGAEPNIGKHSKFVPKVTVKYQIDDDKMVYATYTKGFRPGGVNRGRNDWSNENGECVDSTRRATVRATGEDQGPSCTLFPEAYDPDTVTNYEFGSRMQWDDAFQLNMTFFYMEWNNYQLELLEPSYGRCDEGDALPAPYCNQPWTKVVGNIGSAHTMGIQAEALWVPTDSMNLGGNLTWLEAEIDDDFSEAGSSRGPNSFGAIEKGQDLPNVPKWKGSAWADYAWTTAMGDMTLRGQYSFVGGSNSDLVPTTGDVAIPTLRQASYSIADVSLAVQLEHGEVRFFVNNIFDERAEVIQSPDKFGWLVGHTTEYERMGRQYTNRPREFGIRFITRWGGG